MCLRVRSRYALPLACLGALAWATAYTPAFSQTSAPSANGTDAAQERSQRQSDSVYRWIKLQTEPTRKPDVPKPRVRPEGSTQVTRKPGSPPANIPVEPTQAVADAAATAPPANPEAASDSQATAAATLPASAPGAGTSVTAPETVVEVEVDLKPIFQPQPEIPRDMRASIANGRVVLSFTVQPDGTVREAAVVRTTNRRLGKSALDAISQWRFEPIRVAQTAQVEIEFGLQQ
jgi:TonB family protein